MDILNEKQRRLVEENMDLADIVIRRYITMQPGVPGMEYEELYQIACLALCKAAVRYDGSCKFRTFAGTVLRNRLIDHCRSVNRQKGALSLDAEMGAEEDRNLAGMLPSADDTEESVFSKEALEALARVKNRSSGVTLKGIRALELQVQGYSTREIAAMYGVKSNSVAAWVSRAAKKLREEPELLAALR